MDQIEKDMREVAKYGGLKEQVPYSEVRIIDMLSSIIERLDKIEKNAVRPIIEADAGEMCDGRDHMLLKKHGIGQCLVCGYRTA